ncbi:MAG: HAD-IC family P-type ATPase [Bacilli bacterium]|nr:HAD-IC family P-type ATPase [Bacilli bacterium]
MKKRIKINKEPERYNPSIENGLDENVVSKRKEDGFTNIARNPTNKSYLEIIVGNIFTFFNILMFVIAALLLLLVGRKVVTNLMFLIIIVCNLLIGTIQECKSKHTIEKLKLMNDSKSKVRRSGKDLEILPSEIVLDDVVILSPGDQIPVDGYLLDTDILEVNESLLTGESVPVKKSKGDTIYAGSFVVSGNNYLLANKIGNDTYIQSIERKARVSKQPKSRLMLAINKIIKVMAFIAIPLALIVFANEVIHGVNSNQLLPEADRLPIFPSFWGQETVMTNAIFYSGTTIAYMIPCGMALLASVAMATGVIKLAQNKTLAQNLYSVELLSRVNTLCLDKTGTLTDGTMSVESFEVLDNSNSEEDIKKLISSYLFAFKSTNQTSLAMENKFGKTKNYEIENTIQFSSARKYSAVKFSSLGWYALGAPEYLTGNQDILNKVNEYAKNGLRVILLVKINEEVTNEEVLTGNRTNLAMFIIRDTIRPEVKETMEWFKENDVDIKVISGDNIGTVSYIAKQSGIGNWDKCVDMSKVTENDNLEEIVMNNAIFGRVSPDQKADIIAVLKKNGRVTGVTGDGLNDLLAFKQADCSIALANGAAATKNVANLILLDSNFSNMKEAVFQGRRVVNNIQRSSSLFVMKDFLWLFITILPILLGVNHIVQPTVMSMVNIFITGIATVFLALEPDRTRVKGSFYKNVTKTALVSGFFMFIPVLAIMVYCIIQQIAFSGSIDLNLMKTAFKDGEIISFGWVPTMSLCVTVAGLIVFFENCRPFTKFRKVLFASALIVILLVLYLIPEFFIISGTDMLESGAGSSIIGIFEYEIKHLGPNAMFALYRTMTLEQGLFLLIFSILAYPVYLLNKKLFGALVDKLLFSPREFKDE